MAAPRSQPQAKYIALGDDAGLDRLIDGIATAFIRTELSRAFITEIDNTPPPYPSPSFNVERLTQHFGPAIKDALRDGAEIVEAGDFSALAVWETTSYRGIPFQAVHASAGPIRAEWRATCVRLKNTYIGTRKSPDGTETLNPFYHLGFLARNPKVPVVQGAIAAVLQPWLKRAENEGVPVWLEATYPRAVELYERYGFRLVETCKVGVGARNAEGWPEEGGDGCLAYAMIYDGHLTATKTNTTSSEKYCSTI